MKVVAGGRVSGANAAHGRRWQNVPTLEGSHRVTLVRPFRGRIYVVSPPGVALAYGSLTPGYCLHPLRGCLAIFGSRVMLRTGVNADTIAPSLGTVLKAQAL